MEEKTLVERLRDYSEGWEKMTDWAPEYWHGQAMAEAADRIEWLENELMNAVRLED